MYPFGNGCFFKPGAPCTLVAPCIFPTLPQGFAMDIALWILAAASVLLGLAGLVLPLLPGTPLLLGGLWLAAHLGDYAQVGIPVLLVLALMAAAAWTVDYLAAVIGVKRVGASNKAMAGAGAGALLGVFGGLPGLVIGPIAGAMTGEWVARRNPTQAVRAGLAAGLGFLLAAVVKLGIGLAMVAVFGVAYLI
jgi:uncharacterized protein YqgC (DUF456 family)